MVKDIDIASYEDDSTPFIVENDIDNVIVSLEQVSDALFNWFKNDRLKNNVDKCQVLVSTSKPVDIEIGDYTKGNGECEKLLGVTVDVKLNFNDHITDLWKKASRKISALARVTPFMGLSKRKLLKNAFFTSQFSYFHSFGCHSRSNNRKTNMLHERCLRITYNDKQASFTESLNKGNSVSMHIKKDLQLKCLGSIIDYHHH